MPGSTAPIGIGGGKFKGKLPPVDGKLAEVPVGANVTLKLSPDQQTVLSLRAEGSGFLGTVKGVDAGNNSLTLTIHARKGEAAEEKTFVVASRSMRSTLT